MTFSMKLRQNPFERIASGQKTVELRLYDEKRRRLSVGDIIEFSCDDYPERKLCAEIKALHLFESFAQLYATLPLAKCGYTEDEARHASYTDMLEYYSEEEQGSFGVVGIEFVLLN